MAQSSIFKEAMKFKLGDRVIAIEDALMFDQFPEWTGAIIEIKKDGTIHIKADIGPNWHDKPEALILEEVWNSPLAKVMRENED